MNNDNKFDNNGYGSMWIEKNAKVVRKGSFQLEDEKFYGMVIEKQNNEGKVQHEIYVSMGLLHINKAEDKLNERSPDMSGRVKSPLWGQKDHEGKLKFKQWKLGIWAKESESGVPYSSLGFTEVEEESMNALNEPSSDFEPKF